jgi:tetratricopeptide (TPR) repeat protein
MKSPVRALLILAMLAVAVPAGAQIGRVAGTVQDDTGKPIRGARVRAENPEATPSAFTTVTDDNGRFSLIGLRTGPWKIMAEAPGFMSQAGLIVVSSLTTALTPVTFNLPRGLPGPTGALAGVNMKELQAEIEAADALLNAGQYDQAIAAYQATLVKAPTLTLINLQIGNALRMKREYDRAIEVFQEILKSDPANERAKIQIGMTNLDKGDVAAAETMLLGAAEAPGAGRDVFYSLGEVKFAKNEPDAASRYYQQAFDADPTWTRPLLKLGLVALNRGDRTGAIGFMEKVLAVDPQSADAVQAKTVIEQLSRQ